MKLVILESPRRGGGEEHNLAYAEKCVRDCHQKEKFPIVGALLFMPQLNILEENRTKVNVSSALGETAEKQVFYTDYGMNDGMKYAEANSDLPKEYRKIL